LPRVGTYVLFVRPPAGLGSVTVGKFGKLTLQAGTYLYVGSAFGSGGLRARVRRHLAGSGTLHWHIDYLLRVATVAEVWYTYDPIKREEDWADWFRSGPGVVNPMRGFGAGDCGCDGHLFFLDSDPDFESFRSWAGENCVEVEALTPA